MGFGVLPLMEFLARRAFLGAGLRLHTIALPSPSSDEGGGQRTVHYWAPPGEPRLPPLLLIHGFGPMATWQWRRQVGPLSGHFHVIVPDLLCFGGSSNSPGSPPPSESAQAAALAALLDALPGLKADARRLMDLSFYRRQAIALLPDFVIRGAVQQLFSDKREEKIELMKAITVGTDEFQLTPLPQDVLLIWGDHDQIFPLEKAFAVKRCLGENARLEIFEKTGHVPQMEDPDRFNNVVLDFLLASQKPPSAEHDL